MTNFEHEAVWSERVVSLLNEPSQVLYRKECAKFTRWLAARQLHLTKVTEEDIDRYLVDREPRGATTTLVIKSLFEHLVDLTVIVENPARHVIWRRPVVQRKILDERSIHRFLDQLRPPLVFPQEQQQTTVAKVRTWAIAELVYSSAVKSADVVRLRHEDADFGRLTLSISGRKVPMTEKASEAVQNWLQFRDAKWKVPAPYLFHGYELPNEMMTQKPNSDLARFEIEGPRFTLLDLRHAYILHAAARGMSLLNLCRISGLKPMHAEKILSEYRRSSETRPE